MSAGWSSVMMVAIAVLLVSDNYHIVRDVASRAVRLFASS